MRNDQSLVYIAVSPASPRRGFIGNDWYNLYISDVMSFLILPLMMETESVFETLVFISAMTQLNAKGGFKVLL